MCEGKEYGSAPKCEGAHRLQDVLPKRESVSKCFEENLTLGNILSPVASPRAEIQTIKRDGKFIDHQVY
jgi:hypothetical protein